jgi:hypothetical protein
MALIKTDMQLAGVGGGCKVFMYVTTDASAAVKGAGYFNGMAAQLNPGDRIHAKCSDGLFDFGVNTNNGTVVAVLASVAYA